MPTEWTAQERYQREQLRRQFETCSDMLDEYFSPWRTRLYRRLQCAPQRRFAHRRLSACLLAGVCAFSLVCLILFPALSGTRTMPPAARVYTLSPVSRAALQEDGSASDLTPETEVIDINTATADQLTALPGIGPVLAQRIVDERAARGPFYYPADLMAVPGIGQKTLERLLPRLAFGRDTFNH